MDTLRRRNGRAGLALVIGIFWLAAGCESQPHAQSATSSPSAQADQSPTFSPGLYAAAERGSQSSTAHYLEQGAAINEPNPVNGWTALHVAAFNGHKKLVAYLLSRGADPNARSKDGNTPLHLAAAAGHSKTTAELIAVTDQSIRNNNGKTAREVANPASVLALFPSG